MSVGSAQVWMPHVQTRCIKISQIKRSKMHQWKLVSEHHTRPSLCCFLTSDCCSQARSDLPLLHWAASKSTKETRGQIKTVESIASQFVEHWHRWVHEILKMFLQWHSLKEPLLLWKHQTATASQPQSGPWRHTQASVQTQMNAIDALRPGRVKELLILGTKRGRKTNSHIKSFHYHLKSKHFKTKWSHHMLLSNHWWSMGSNMDLNVVATVAMSRSAILPSALKSFWNWKGSALLFLVPGSKVDVTMCL